MPPSAPASAATVPRRVWGGTALMVAGRVWGSACTLAYLALLAQHLRTADFGRFTFYLALFQVLDALVDLGTSQVAVQRTARDPARVPAVLRPARRMRLLTGSIGVVLVGGGALVAGEPGAGWILLACLYPLTHALELSTVVFKNRIAWGRPVSIRAVAAFLSLAFVVALQQTGVMEPALYLVAVAAGSTAGNLLLYAAARPLVPPPSGPPESMRSIARAALPMGIAGLCQQTYFWIDNLFVRPLAGEEALGHYNLAVRLMSFGIMAAVYASLAALPWLTREHAAGRLAPAVARLAWPMSAAAGLATGIAWPWSREILALFGREGEFAAAAPSLEWLLLATLAVYAGAPLVTATVAAGRARAFLAVAVLGLLVNVAGNALLVPARGIEGAAIATFATELAVALGAAVVVHRTGRPGLPGRRALLWTAGPVLFILGRLASGLLAP